MLHIRKTSQKAIRRNLVKTNEGQPNAKVQKLHSNLN